MSANAQVWVGGSLGTQIEKNHTAFSIAPEVGYMITPKFTFALGVNYGYDKYEYAGLSTKTSTLFLQPYFRYVGGTIGHKFSLFVDL